MNARYCVKILKPLDYADNGYLLEALEAEGNSGSVALANLYYESGLVAFAHPNFVRRRHLRTVGLKEMRKAAPVSSKRLVEPHRDRSQYLSRQWHLQTAKVIAAWNITRGSRAIKIAILDDGVDVGHPEMTGKVVAQYDFASGNSDGRPNSSADTSLLLGR